MRWLIRGLSSAGIVAIVASIAFAFTGAAQFDPDAACVGNAKLLQTAVAQYVQDYDIRLPPTTTTAAFDAALRPYTSDSSVFVCPATGTKYKPNAAISEKTLTQFADLSSVILFQDQIPHPDGKSTVAYADGSVLLGGKAFGNVNTLCVQRARQIALGVLQYTQDWDEKLPPRFSTAADLKAAVYPYVRDSRDFLCPATDQAYVPNGALAGVSLASISDRATTVMFTDPKPHDDGFRTIAYMDGHVVHGVASPTPVTDTECASNLKQLGLSVLQYTQDYNESFPVFSNTQQLVAATAPYNQGAVTSACPITHDEYISNTALSGISVAAIANPSATWLVRDAFPHPDGTAYTLWADGHVNTLAISEPKSLSILPGNDSVLLWTTVGGNADLWKFGPDGQLLGQTVIDAGTPALTTALPPLTSVVASPSGKVALFANSQGSSDMLYLDSSWAITRSVLNGPYDGWTPTAMAVGSNEQPHLLWDRWDGLASDWDMTTSPKFLGDSRLLPRKSLTATALAVAPDNTQRLLSVGPGGAAEISILAVNSEPYGSVYLPAVQDGTPIAIAGGRDWSSHLLSTSPGGAASIVTVNVHSRTGSRPIIRSFPIGAGSDWQAVAFAVGTDENYRVAYAGSAGLLFQVFSPTGTLLASETYARPS